VPRTRPPYPEEFRREAIRLVTGVRNSLAVGGEAGEDLVGGLVPDVGLGVLVPVGDSGTDRGDEVFDRAVGAAFDPLLAQFCERALDEV
jgi:hypothetical protein